MFNKTGGYKNAEHRQEQRKRESSILPGGPTGYHTTAPALESELKTSLDGMTALTLDFAGLEYISSAGLRVLLSAQKTMNKQGSMKLVHVNETIMEIFEVTGFSDILTVE